MNFKPHRWFRTRNKRRTAADTTSLRLESLEERVTPTTNLRINNVHFTAPAVGALTNVIVDFQTEDLPFLTNYKVQVQMNGVFRSSASLGWGSGAAGIHTWSIVLGDWLVNDVNEAIQVGIFPQSDLAEQNVLDNLKQFTVESATFDVYFDSSQKLATPIGGTPFKNWTISNYVDLDSSAGVKDYKGKSRTHDGSDGLDFRIDGWESMDNGVPVYAAADGIVSAAHDGVFDHAVTTNSNYITIDHGTGWTTSYDHLRKDSVAVSVGDFVKRGQIIGLVGSSGSSTGPKLHFGVRYYGSAVEPYVAPNAYWVSPLAYAGALPQSGYQLQEFTKHYITENAGYAKIVLHRPTPYSKLHYFTFDSNQSANQDVDFTSTSGDVIFADGETTKDVYIPIINNDRHEPLETFGVEILAPGQTIYNTLGQQWTIIDDDANFNLNGGTFTIKGSENGVYLDYLHEFFFDPNRIGIVIDGNSVKANVNGDKRKAKLDAVNKIVIDTGAGDDTIKIHATPFGVPTLIFAGDGDDTINVGAAGSLTPVLGAVEVDGGTGENTVNIYDQLATMQANHAVPRTYTIQNHTLSRAGVGTISYSGINSFETVQNLNLFTAASGDTFAVKSVEPDVHVLIAGGGGNDSIVGPNVADEWTVYGGTSGVFAGGAFHFTSIENLTGGADDDTFKFANSANLSGNLKGGDGADTLKYDGNGLVSVNLATSKATKVGGTIAELEGATAGSNAGDQLIGANADQSWVISGPDVARVGGFSANSFENLVGGNQADTFRFIFDGNITGKIDGGAGADTLNYTKIGTAITVDLASKKYPLVGNVAHIEAVAGTSLSDTLIGVGVSSGINSWNITGVNSGHFHSANAQLDFSGIENLVGGTNSDLFEFFDSASVTGVIDGKGAGDILSYQTYTSPVTVNLENSTATATGGFANIEFLFGGVGSDTLIAGNAANSWRITGANAGKLNGNSFTFSGIENLSGNFQSDTFVFANGAGVTGNIDGGVGVDTLDFSAYSTSVKVDLTGGTATGTAGVANFENAFGGSAGDDLTGNAADNFLNGNGGADLLKGLGGADILLGGPGDDVLDGGDGNDFLIGGINVDKVTGGNGDDLLIGGDMLIGGVVSHASNGVGLDLMRTQWKRTDLTYGQRIDLLRNTGVNSGLFKLNADNIIDDVTVDTLTGGADQDWYWAGAPGPGRDQMDNSVSEQIN